MAGTGGTASAAAGCSVTYTVEAFCGTGFVALLTVTPGSAVTGWTVDFDLADQQLMTNTHNASFVQNGSHIQLTNASFNGTIAAGASALVGLSVYTNPTLTRATPTTFSINGQVCSSTVSR